MANIVATQEMANKVNFWRKYKDPKALDDDIAAIENYYRIHPFDPTTVVRPAPVTIPQVLPFAGPPSTVPLALKIPAEQNKQGFMNQAAVPGLPTGAGNWKGVVSWTYQRSPNMTRF